MRSKGWFDYCDALDVTAAHYKRIAAIVSDWPGPLARVRFLPEYFREDLRAACRRLGLAWSDEIYSRIFDAESKHHEAACVVHPAQAVFEQLAALPAREPTPENAARVAADALLRERLLRRQQIETDERRHQAEVQLAESRSTLAAAQAALSNAQDKFSIIAAKADRLATELDLVRGSRLWRLRNSLVTLPGLKRLCQPAAAGVSIRRRRAWHGVGEPVLPVERPGAAVGFAEILRREISQRRGHRIRRPAQAAPGQQEPMLGAYVDRHPVEVVLRLFPELKREAHGIVRPDFLLNLDCDDFHVLRDRRYDFFIANHVIEHLVNPLRFLEKLNTVMAEGSILYLAVPDKRYTFDVNRAITSSEHLWQDYVQNTQDLSEEHLLDFLVGITKDHVEPCARARMYFNRNWLPWNWDRLRESGCIACTAGGASTFTSGTRRLSTSSLAMAIQRVPLQLRIVEQRCCARYGGPRNALHPAKNGRSRKR